MAGPDYTPPTPPAANSFRDAAKLSERTVQGQAPNLESWWHGFGDPELSNLVDRALAQNLDLAQAEARVTQARAQASAAGAALLPSGQANAQGAYSHASLNSSIGQIEQAFPGFDRDQSQYDLSASASWEIDLFGGLRRASQAARAQYEASEAARAATALTVAAATADAYVQVRALQARIQVAQDQVESQRRLVALVETQFKRGLAPQLQLDQAKGALSDVASALPVLRAGLEGELNALEVLVGVMPGTLHAELAKPEPVPAAPAIEAAGGPASLVRRRPDIIAAERNLASADAKIGAALSDYYPKISLSGLLGFESTSIPNLISAASFQPQATAGLRWRLFDFGRVNAEVVAAKGARAEALAAYRNTVLQATADVETSLTTVVEREQQARILDEGESALAHARSASGTAYQAGRVSLIEVLNADTALLATRDQKVQAHSEAARAAIASFKALGGGWSG